jgi:predicted anti-sigma-YlaC factor YlaD
MTMDCTTCRDRLLEADLPDLRGEGDPDLAAHLAACLACRGFASAILAAEAERAAAGRQTAPPPGRPPRPRAAWRGIGAVLAVALAAFLVVLLLTRTAPARPTVRADRPSPAMTAPPRRP